MANETGREFPGYNRNGRQSMEPLTRRQFLRVATMGGAVLGASWKGVGCGFAYAAVPSYRGASFVPPAYKSIRYGVLGFVENLQKNVGSALNIEFYDSASLMTADEQLPGLRVGAIQFMFHSSTYISGEYPILGIIELPGVCEQLYEHGERLAMESPLWKLINDELAKRNLFMLSTGSGTIEPEFIWSGKKKIAGLADLQGRHCRVVSPEAMEFLKYFGLTGIRIPSEQIYLALQRGLVDSVLSPVDTVIARNLFEHLQLCFKIPVTAATHAVFLLKDVWDGMPDKEKAYFWEAGRWYDENQGKTGYKKITREEYWPVITKAGIRVVLPTEADCGIFRQKSQFAWDSWIKRVGEDVGRRAMGMALGNAL